MSRPAPESTDIHGARRTGPAPHGNAVEQHRDPRQPPPHSGTTDNATQGIPGSGRSQDEHPPYHPGRQLRCPVCDVAMGVRYLGSVEIDQCPKCDGVFLDRGELQELTHISASSFQSATPSAGALIYTPHGLTSHVWEHSPEKSDHS